MPPLSWRFSVSAFLLTVSFCPFSLSAAVICGQAVIGEEVTAGQVCIKEGEEKAGMERRRGETQGTSVGK